MQVKRRRGRVSAMLGLAVYSAFAGAASAAEGVWTSYGLPPGHLSSIAIDPADSSVVYAAISPDGTEPSQGELFRGIDHGKQWLLVAKAPPGTSIASIAIDPSDGNTLYALVSSGDLYRSRDRGARWTWIHSFKKERGTLRVDPSNPKRVFLAGSSCDCGSAGCFVGDCVATVLRSGDAGVHWEDFVVGAGASGVNAFVSDRNLPQVMYAGTELGLYKTRNGGASWSQISSEVDGNCTPVSAIAIDGRDSRTLLVGFFEHFYAFFECGNSYRSLDAGIHWGLIGGGLPAHVTSFVFDPATEGSIYAAAEDFKGGSVYRSLDRGSSWELVGPGLEGRYPSQLVVDRSGTVLYVATEAGVFDYEAVVTPGLVLPPRRRQRPRQIPDRLLR